MVVRLGNAAGLVARGLVTCFASSAAAGSDIRIAAAATTSLIFDIGLLHKGKKTKLQ
jgi:hypothetical protein